tara:strand:- start:5216 stop:6253 length:1038 start_codon:yes stop_codon:yes gene_type:complete
VKRGLVVKDPTEISDAEWDARIGAVQLVMAESGLDFTLVYGDVFRSDDINYLTNLCIYWNEGVVAIPLVGAPILLTKLSPRVHTWMRKTSTMTDLRSGAGFGELAEKLVVDTPHGVLGLVDADLWPAPIVDEISAAIPGWEVKMLGSVVRDQRALPSPAETTLLRRGSKILSDAVAAASGPGLSPTDRIAQLERDLRGGGFTDTAIEVSQAPEGVLTLEVTGQYRNGWPHASRLVVTGQTPLWQPLLPAALEAAIAAVHPGAPWASVVAAAATHLSALPSDTLWAIRCVNQADMATNGELLSAERTLNSGEVVILALELLHSGSTRSVVAETLLVTADGAEQLTV